MALHRQPQSPTVHNLLGCHVTLQAYHILQLTTACTAPIPMLTLFAVHVIFVHDSRHLTNPN